MSTGSTALTIRSPALDLDAGIVPWDTESFGVPVAQVWSITVRDPRSAASDLAPLAQWLADGQVRLAACRLPHDGLAESFALEAVGFRFVEMVYGMRFRLDPALAPASEALSAAEEPMAWETARIEDLARLQAMAADAFVTGRWNVDPRVGPALGGRRYADWVARSFDETRHQLLAARVAGELAGFFIVEDKADGSTYWHLTAVAQGFQGRGIGRRMWASMLARHAAAGRRCVETTISARNIPVVNLYARSGWTFASNQMTFHWAHPDWTARDRAGDGR